MTCFRRRLLVKKTLPGNSLTCQRKNFSLPPLSMKPIRHLSLSYFKNISRKTDCLLERIDTHQFLSKHAIVNPTMRNLSVSRIIHLCNVIMIEIHIALFDHFFLTSMLRKWTDVSFTNDKKRRIRQIIPNERKRTMRTLYISIFLSLVCSTTSYPKSRTVRDANIEDLEEIGKSKQTTIWKKISFVGGDFEGDILLAPDTFYRGIGKLDPSARWPNGIVPFEISSAYGKHWFLVENNYYLIFMQLH